MFNLEDETLGTAAATDDEVDIDITVTIPTPSAALAGLGLMGVMAVGRRRR
jgi:uncharacterized protein (TIGR03382 family)